MIIGGLQKISLLDYPNHLSAIIFTKSCNFRCHFCYNPQLVVPVPPRLSREAGWEPASQRDLFDVGFDHLANGGGTQKDHLSIEEDGLFEFLKKRKGKLEAVVITGGEPTMHKDLPEFIAKIKNLGYLIKLDTNGTNPEMLQRLIEDKLIDYVAMDIKAPLDKYEQVVGVKVLLNNIEKSIKITKESPPLREGGGKYEFRTTLVPELLDISDIKKIGEMIKGANKWYLQKFKSDTSLVNRELENKKPYTEKEMKKMADMGRKYVKHCETR